MVLDGPERACTMIAIDPGETCGVAMFQETQCYKALPMTSLGCCYFVEAMLKHHQEIREIVVERFRLYASKARQQTGSSFRTVEVIGVIKWLCTKRDVPCILIPADVKNATAGNMRGRNIRPVAEAEKSADREHAKDAEQIGYYRLFETKQL